MGSFGLQGGRGLEQWWKCPDFQMLEAMVYVHFSKWQFSAKATPRLDLVGIHLNFFDEYSNPIFDWYAK